MKRERWKKKGDREEEDEKEEEEEKNALSNRSNSRIHWF